MYYDIVPIVRDYRGVARLFEFSQYTKQVHKQYNHLLERYFDYCSNVMKAPTREGMIELVDIHRVFLKQGIECEIIAFDTSPMETAFGYPVIFLGIDIVHTRYVSMLLECTNNEIWEYLNANGLCDSEEAARNIIPFINRDGAEWEPYYVYKVNC